MFGARRSWILPPLIAVSALGAAQALAARGFRARAAALTSQLGGNAGESRAISRVPEIVQVFACRAASGSVIPALVSLGQRGDMRANPGDIWKKFSAKQTISVRVPGFVWLARMQIAPLIAVHVLDAYAGGKGQLEARLLGALRISRASGPGLDRGELMRYLAELAWVPQAMLHNPHLHWRQLDAATVEVSAASAGGPARVRLAFEAGDLRRVDADDRPRTVGSAVVPTPWYGRFEGYRTIAGVRIPTRAEVGWVPDGRPFACWRGEITAYDVH